MIHPPLAANPLKTRADLQRAMAVRKQIEGEKQKQNEVRDALLERKAQVAELENGNEVIRGTLESFVEINEGDSRSRYASTRHTRPSIVSSFCFLNSKRQWFARRSSESVMVGRLMSRLTSPRL